VQQQHSLARRSHIAMVDCHVAVAANAAPSNAITAIAMREMALFRIMSSSLTSTGWTPRRIYFCDI
jgi:prepilin-type processing-associated H-X9-DG protein